MLLLTTLVALALPASGESPCSTEFAAAPTRYESALCYYREASASGHWLSAIGALAQHTENYPQQAWTQLVTGYLQMEAGAGRAAAVSYRTAATRFNAEGELRGELLATINLTATLNKLGEASAAQQAIDRVRALGRQSSNPELQLRAINAEAQHRLSQGNDPGSVLPALEQAEQNLDQIDSYWLRRETRNLLAAVLQALGKPAAASQRYRNLMVDSAAADDLNGLALAQFNLANALLVAGNEAPRRADRTAIERLALSALHDAIGSGNPRVRAIAHRLLAELSFLSDPDLAGRHLKVCAELSKRHELGRPGSECAWLRARIVASTDSVQALALMAQASGFAEAANDPFYQAFATRHRLRVLWQTTGPEAAFQASLNALDALDRLRTRQTLLNGARVMSAWARDYQWLASQALEMAATTDGVERERWIERALNVSERARAVGLRQALKGADSSTNAVRKEPALSLGELRDRLAGDEALLVLTSAPVPSVQGESAGASWGLLIHRTGVGLQSLPDDERVRQISQLLSTQLRGATGASHTLTDAAQQQLLGTLLAQAPATTRHLSIVADPALQATPFAALTDPSTGHALIEDFSLSQVPALGTWYEVRASGPAARQRGLLTIANPRSTGSEPQLQPLPAAEQAAPAIAHLFGSRLNTLARDSATISNLRRRLANPQIGTVHFATHTAIEAQSPVLVLANESGQRHRVSADGRLRPATLETLNLNDRLVVFAACASATGEPLRGEGTLGLVRSAFIAGARAVVGTLWPVRDDHALAFSTLFYRALSAGQPVAEALAAAQRQARQNGLPAELWAAYVLHGDSRFRIKRAVPSQRLIADTGGR